VLRLLLGISEFLDFSRCSLVWDYGDRSSISRDGVAGMDQLSFIQIAERLYQSV
jgi:hypothetical protein